MKKIIFGILLLVFASCNTQKTTPVVLVKADTVRRNENLEISKILLLNAESYERWANQKAKEGDTSDAKVLMKLNKAYIRMADSVLSH
jgi:hypothetical protein